MKKATTKKAPAKKAPVKEAPAQKAEEAEDGGVLDKIEDAAEAVGKAVKRLRCVRNFRDRKTGQLFERGRVYDVALFIAKRFAKRFISPDKDLD